MAKYTITHTCGCKETVQLFGKESDRARKTEWLETIPCVDCQRKAEREAAEKSAAALSLPGLVGSEKQVAWAITIRNIAINELTARNGGKVSADAMAVISNITSAGWWIDHRNRAADYIVAQTPAAKRAEAERAAELEPRMLESIGQYKAASEPKKVAILDMMHNAAEFGTPERAKIAREFLRRIGVK